MTPPKILFLGLRQNGAAAEPKNLSDAIRRYLTVGPSHMYCFEGLGDANRRYPTLSDVLT